MPGTAQGAFDVLDAPITDDAGPDTQDRYGWQHHCTAADAIRMLADGGVVRVVCEVHQDYVIEHSLGFTLVSCKHRELTQGPWGLYDLCLSGGLAQLFQRWDELGAVWLKLVTNAGLKPGALEAAAVSTAMQSLSESVGDRTADETLAAQALAVSLIRARRHKKAFTAIPLTPKPAKKEADEIPPEFLDRVVAFMRVTTIRPEAPSRALIESHHAHEVMKPALVDCGLGHIDPVKAYAAVLNLISQRNRANALTGRYAFWFWGREPTEGPRGSQAALVAARTVTRQDLVRACRGAAKADPQPLLQPHQSDHTRLNVKLQAGKVGPVRRNEAARLREAWLAYRLQVRSGLPGDAAEQYDLDTRLLGLAGDAEAVARIDGQDHWGDRFITELKRLTQGLSSEPLGSLSREHVLGAAFDLAANCHVWFSEEFDVDGVLKDLSQDPE